MTGVASRDAVPLAVGSYEIDIGTDGLNVRMRMDGLIGLAREMRAEVGAAA